jgi:uncharacterized protein
LKNPSELRIDVAPHGATSGFVYPAENAAAASGALILAHGAGSGQRSPFISEFARAIAALGFDVVTFNFLYMEQRRRAPDRAPVLEACFRAAISVVQGEIGAAKRALFIGGKSMGGRIGTQVAAADRGLGIAGIVLLGYPLHPPGRPHERRDAHLPSIERPTLFIQGSRDAFGTPGELAPVLAQLGSSAVLHVVEGGDHSFKVPRAAAGAQAAVFKDIQRTVAGWMATISGR